MASSTRTVRAPSFNPALGLPRVRWANRAPVARPALRAALVLGWAWGAINVVASAPPAALPAPPYTRFAGHNFEPSAAAFDPITRRVLVLSEHDTTLYRYELGEEGLALPRGEHHDPLRLAAGVHAARLEGLTRFPSGEFLAVTAFDRPDPRYRRVLRFSYSRAEAGPAVSLAVDDTGLEAAIRAASRMPWFKVKALAVDRRGTKVLFGVGRVGESGEAPHGVALVVRCPLADNRVGPPEAVIQLSTAEEQVAEGLSDLQLDPERDSFLLLTSHEGIDNTQDGHSGHLFRVPAGALLGTAASAIVPLGAPLREFRARPEGLAVEPSGAVVVVFDDDRDWRRLFAGYEQSDGLFTVIDPRP